MGHAVGYTDCLNTEEAKAIAVAEINKLAIQNGDYHTPIQPIRWENVICNSREEAHEWIIKNQGSWYDQLAVKYYDHDDSEKAQELKTRISKLRERKEKFEAATIPSVAKTSKHLSCRGCGSILARRYLSNKSARCPLCGTDMRSKTYQERIENYRNRIIQLEEQLEEEIKKSTKATYGG